MNDKIFDEWINSYPESVRGEFHKDGIIDPDVFSKEKIKILYVVKEPNSKNGNYDKYQGVDLRKIWGEICLKKPFDYNIARWTKIICDGVDAGHSLSWDEVAKTVRRVAIINLKKISGGGSEDREEVCLYSFNDRKFLREQIMHISPSVIFACGKDGFVLRMLWRIMNDEMCCPIGKVKSFGVTVPGRMIPVYSVFHPSLRLKKQEDEAAAVISNIVIKKIVFLEKSAKNAKSCVAQT